VKWVSLSESQLTLVGIERGFMNVTAYNVFRINVFYSHVIIFIDRWFLTNSDGFFIIVLFIDAHNLETIGVGFWKYMRQLWIKLASRKLIGS
jgi:hypothetical protein